MSPLGENYFPLLSQIFLCFPKIHQLFTYMDFPRISPYFDHDAFMHHPMHVLDASEFCCPTQSARSSRSLRSADQGLLRVPFARISTRQKRSFAVAGPSIWNDLPLS